ncbi:uncharacterized protein Tco025E_09895, partial [Trypanosoma conorhini]
MTERGGEETHAAAESPATNAQRRHAWPGSDGGGSNQPPAQRRGVEEAPAGPQWALYSTVEEVLRLEGVDATEQITLKDFIRKYVDPDFVLDEGRNVMMGVFARRPEHYIRDERLLRRILNSPACQKYTLRADVIKLMEHRVGNLRRWKGFHQKDIVAAITRSKLNAALEVAEVLERAKRVKEVARRPLSEGFYDSVLKARWSHVLGFPEGEGEDEVEMRMEVKAGQAPAQSWEYKMQGTTLRSVSHAGQFTAPRPRLMVLTSEKGWPYLLQEGTDMKDCYVNREADRVWRIVQGDLSGAFGVAGQQCLDLRRRLVIGTPGMGASMSVGFYLLHQLLRYDAGQRP